MKAAAYYNEFEPYAAQWLRNLIAEGLIADGEVDERSIVDVRPDDVRGFAQCHFFAGLGGWSYAARLAGWPDDRPLWTGSCPCQPFSAAGKGTGFADERHLWPEFYRLISECRPAVVFGEQVASKDGLAWLDTVCADMEASGYAAGAADLCAAGVGAPHIRQRLYFVGKRMADAGGVQPEQPARERAGSDEAERGRASGEPAGRCDACRMGDDHHAGLEGQRSGHQAEGGWLGAVRPVAEAGQSGGLADTQHHDGRADLSRRGPEGRAADGRDGATGRLADAMHAGRPEGRAIARHGQIAGHGGDSRPGPTNGHWGAADWLHCRDGRWRPVEPGTFPLAHGAPARVGRLRAYGNAIVPQAAAEVIAAFMECKP